MSQVFKDANQQSNDLLTKEQQRPRASTPEQLEKIRNSAIKEFGLTDRFSNAFYMLPDGRMLDGTGGQRWGRAYDHRDINSPYYNNQVDLQDDEGGNSTNMMDFMRGGHIRMIPELNGIDLMAKPTDAQLNQIYKMFNRGLLNNIQVSSATDKYGQQLGYLEDIQSERQIADFLRKYYN